MLSHKHLMPSLPSPAKLALVVAAASRTMPDTPAMRTTKAAYDETLIALREAGSHRDRHRVACRGGPVDRLGPELEGSRDDEQ
jgi:hypothetical protein